MEDSVLAYVLSAGILDEYRLKDSSLSELIDIAHKPPEIWQAHKDIMVSHISSDPARYGDNAARRLNFLLQKGGTASGQFETNLRRVVEYCASHPGAEIWSVHFNGAEHSYIVLCGLDNEQVEDLYLLVGGRVPESAMRRDDYDAKRKWIKHLPRESKQESMSRELISEILEAIAYFVERQQLVVQAMQDLDIDLDDVGRWGEIIWERQGNPHLSPSLPEEVLDKARDLWAAIQRAHSRKTVTQEGVWGDTGEWTYFLHGIGCRLRHTLTGEVIDWDCPNPQAFDPYFFLDHLRWRLETEPESSLPQIRKWGSEHPRGLESIINLLVQMVEAGLINSDWTLPDAD